MNDNESNPISVTEGRLILVLFERLRDLPESERQRWLAAESLSAAGRDRLQRMLRLFDGTAALMDKLSLNARHDD